MQNGEYSQLKMRAYEERPWGLKKKVLLLPFALKSSKEVVTPK